MDIGQTDITQTVAGEILLDMQDRGIDIDILQVTRAEDDPEPVAGIVFMRGPLTQHFMNAIANVCREHGAQLVKGVAPMILATSSEPSLAEQLGVDTGIIVPVDASLNMPDFSNPGEFKPVPPSNEEKA